MARYDISYACGHSGTANLYGPHRSRESRLAYLESGECFECYKQHSSEKAHHEAEQLELPQLIGTENQVSWAETLRIQKLAELESEIEHFDHESEKYRLALMALEKISNETSAKKWIEWRYDHPSFILSSVLREMKDAPTQEQIQADREAKEKADAIKRQALLEATIRPDQTVCEMAAEIQIQKNVISVSLSERRDDFKKLVKSLGYSWSDGIWKRTIDGLAGSPVDRFVELGCMLLSHGFIICVFDSAVRAKIVSNEFKPEQTRWIQKVVSDQHYGWFAVKWGPNEDYYQSAKKLPNSRYSSPYVVIPPEQFEQVLDFAQIYDFKVSRAAQEIADQARADKESTLIVSKKPVEQREKIVVSAKPPVLVVPNAVEVADELRESD